MTILAFRAAAVLVCCLSVLPVTAQQAPVDQAAALRLPAVLSDGMVLQQQAGVALWGWAAPGAAVAVTVPWLDTVARATADADGRWRVELRTPKADGQPGTVTVRCGDATRELRDVVLGEVWLCSGQSNMEWPLQKSVPDPDAEIAAAACPDLRLFTVRRAAAPVERDDCEGRWARCTPEVARDFSAVGYILGRTLQARLGVPVGIVNTSWGGTVAEAWTSPAGLAAFPEFAPALAQAAARGEAPADARPNPNVPAVLYRGMIAPLVPFAVRGFAWYQGESNRTRADQYRSLFPALIRDWRRLWGAELPFYFVQIAPFEYQNDRGEAAELRDAQAAALALPGTGMVVTLDVGDPKDIHPRRKREVGERLAALALHRTYGLTDVACDGPVCTGVAREGAGLRLRFDHAAGLAAGPDGPAGFELAGADGVFHPATARIDGDSVVVRAAAVAAPTQVRYAWAAAPVADLRNGAGLPAAPFRRAVP